MRLPSMALLRPCIGMLLELRCCSGKTSKAALWQSEQSYGHRLEPERSLMDFLTRLRVPSLGCFPLTTIWSLSWMKGLLRTREER